jgi:hypothetical protein
MLIFNKFDLADFFQGMWYGAGLAGFAVIILLLVWAFLVIKRKWSGAGPDSDGKKYDLDDA